MGAASTCVINTLAAALAFGSLDILTIWRKRLAFDWRPSAFHRTIVTPVKSTWVTLVVFKFFTMGIYTALKVAGPLGALILAARARNNRASGWWSSTVLDQGCDPTVVARVAFAWVVRIGPAGSVWSRVALGVNTVATHTHRWGAAGAVWWAGTTVEWRSWTVDNRIENLSIVALVEYTWFSRVLPLFSVIAKHTVAISTGPFTFIFRTADVGRFGKFCARLTERGLLTRYYPLLNHTVQTVVNLTGIVGANPL